MVFPLNHLTYPINTAEIWGKKCEPDATICCCLQILSKLIRFQITEVLSSRDNQGCWTFLYFAFQIPLWAQFYWVLLRCSKTVLVWALWYDFQDLKGKHAKLYHVASVQLATICKWEHWVHKWMKAYWEGLSTQDAQAKVKQFSFTRIQVSSVHTRDTCSDF